ncbi:hypothetical protein [Bradyrhizobium sp. NP1]|uniref:hypothetical protein n=1 Tax=Bradyrhizobium sp. NP1 TaxID=3049772 RepID=UPI0025A4D08F|nr:hypothetical protein [Bradyrhizobium sp. NP1]WJR76485.1 hypothetical protein QOU61_27530 [Bradyrhizobium sp. NP1]
MSAPALAEDYSIDYAIGLRGAEDTGSAVCQFGRRCTISVKTLKLKLGVWLLNNRAQADLNMDGEANCCLFEGAVRRLSVQPQQELLRLRLFVGEEAKGLEFIQNEHVGRLYLKFHLRPDRVFQKET